MEIDFSLDYHAHILPGCDHGSDSIETSLKQLEMAAAVGIKTVCATPHFYPHKESVDGFLQRRTKTADLLINNLPNEAPQVQLGAEVLICDGIEKMDGLSCLCREGTKELLVEMPFYEWTDSIWDTLYCLCERQDVHVVLAHADRYPKDYIEQLAKDGVPLQINVASLMKRFNRRKYLNWIENGYVKYLGSDIHMLCDEYQKWAKCRKLLGK